MEVRRFIQLCLSVSHYIMSVRLCCEADALDWLSHPSCGFDSVHWAIPSGEQCRGVWGVQEAQLHRWQPPALLVCIRLCAGRTNRVLLLQDQMARVRNGRCLRELTWLLLHRLPQNVSAYTCLWSLKRVISAVLSFWHDCLQLNHVNYQKTCNMGVTT